uniref:ALOG domain-containing protein n=1 Tax=Ananas comosus var. bracteatus TaxID=296719 RepID=A0A6V7NKF3_ANACO|nr:unnamed protein product [Ananas comosus var. bracteatus]
MGGSSPRKIRKNAKSPPQFAALGQRQPPTAGAAAGAGAAVGGVGGASSSSSASASPSRYESQKRRDWNTFVQYLANHRPAALTLAQCGGAHVLEFLRYLDQFGKTKVHVGSCPFFGHPNPPAPCPCPLRQAWGSLDALVGRLRAAYEENGGGRPENNPFAARAVRLYLREVRQHQEKARGISYEKKKRKKQPLLPPPPCNAPPPTTIPAAAAPAAAAASSSSSP